MATVTFTAGGQTYSAPVDGYETMSPEDQDQVHQAMINMAHPENNAASASADPAPATPAAPSDTSLTSALSYGLHGAAVGLGNTVQTVGDSLGIPAVSNAGKSLQTATTGPGANYAPTNEGADYSAGNYQKMLTDLPRAAVEGAAPTAALLGAGAVAGPWGVAGTAAALNYGNNVKTRAANNNEPTTSADAMLGAVVPTAVDAGLAAVGLGKVGPGAALMDAAPALAKPFVGAALDAGAGAATDASNQLGATVGTDKGAQLDPNEVVGAAAQAGGARLASLAPQLAAVGIRTGTNEVMTRLQPDPASTEDAASIVRVNNDFEAAAANAKATRGDVSPMAVMNTVKSEYLNNAIATIADLRAAPDGANIDPIQARQLTALFRDQAARHNNTIQEGQAAYQTLFDRINSLPLPDEAIATLTNAARDLNTISTQSFQNKGTGPFATLGRVGATAAGIGGALYMGDPMAAIGLGLGHGAISPIGGLAGGAMDRLFGTNVPTVTLRARKAQLMLSAAGQTPGQSSLDGMQNLRGALGDLPTATAPVSFTVSAPGAPLAPEVAPAKVASQTNKAWAAQTGPAAKVPDLEDAWAAAEAQANAAKAKSQSYLAGMNLPGQNVDPLNGVPTVGADVPMSDGADLAAQQAKSEAGVVAQARAMAALKNQIAARNGAVSTLAQAKLDKAAIANAVKLAAGNGMSPTPRDDVTTTAVNAAVNGAISQARGVMQQATGSADPDTGLPNDPVPVNTPISASGVPLGRAQRSVSPPQPASPVDPVAASVGIPQAQPQAAFGGPETAAINGTKLEGYIANGNPTHTRGAVHAAIHATFPDQAAALIAHGEAGGGIDPVAARAIQAQLRGVSSPEGSAPADATADQLRALRYQGGIENNRAAVMAQHAAALAANHHEAAAGLLDVLQTHDADPAKNVAAKAAARDSALSAIKDAKHRAAASKYFTKRIMHHGPRPVKGK
jgi:hypothetical protein